MPLPSEEFTEEKGDFFEYFFILQTIFYELMLNFSDLDYCSYFKKSNLVDEEHESIILINLP